MFPKIFEIIDGHSKLNNWHRKFSNFYRNLYDLLQVADINKNFDDLSKYLTICKSLTSLDNFLKENGKSFERLYIQYKSSLLLGNRETIKNILESISKLDFARTNELLAQINENPINPKDIAQIKFDLKTELNKLMRDTTFKVKAFDETIEGIYSTENISFINNSILLLDLALSKIELNEYLDSITKAELQKFRDTINEIFSNIVIKALNSIENFLKSFCLIEAINGLKSTSEVIKLLNECSLSTRASEKLAEVLKKRDNIAEEIKKREWPDITNYVYDPPINILTILKDLGNASPRFRQAHTYLLEKVRKSVQLAIDNVKNVSYDKLGDKIENIKFALNWIPNELIKSCQDQLVAFENSIHENYKQARKELENVIKCVNENDSDIKHLGELAKEFNERGMKELFYKLNIEILRRMRILQEKINIKLRIDNEDLSGALEDFKVLNTKKVSVVI